MKPIETKLKFIIKELRAHLPFTFLGVLTGVGVLAIVHWMFVILGESDRFSTFRTFYHTFHYLHVFLSAIASAALFYRHTRDIPKTVLVSFIGTIIPCGLSDAILPYVGGAVLGLDMHFHLCLLEEPGAVIFANGIGIIVGIITETRFGKISYFSHGGHVFVSSFASLFYLATYGIENWTHAILGITVISALAVIIPCCSSDIVIPVSFMSGFHGHEHEDEHTALPHEHKKDKPENSA